LSSQIELPRHVAFSPRVVSLADDSLTFVAAGWKKARGRRHELRFEQWQHAADSENSVSLGVFVTGGRGGLALSGNARILVLVNAAEDVVIWNLDDPDRRPKRVAIDGHPSSFAVNYDGSLVAVALESTLRLISNGDDPSWVDIPIKAKSLRDLAFSDGGRVLAGATDQCLLAWKLTEPPPDASGAEDGAARSSMPAKLTATPLVSAGGDAALCVPPANTITSVGLDPVGMYAAAGGKDGTVWLWRLSGSAELVRHFKAHNGQINDLSFRPRNGHAILTSGDDGTVRLWSIEGLALARFAGHQGRVLDVAFSTNGYTAASVGKDDTVRVWAAHWKQWVTLGCRRLSNHSRFRRPELTYDDAARERAENARRACERLDIQKTTG
jgi:WD40 repeat protein